MVGLSQKLTSLVQAAEDPDLLLFAITQLGVGVPEDNRSRALGFRQRVERIRSSLFEKLVRGFMNPQIHAQEKERRLALQLFQKGTLTVTVRRLAQAKPDELRSLLVDKDPLVRFLTVQSIGRRWVHLETELIERLKDPYRAVRDAARIALVRVTRGTDFGPIPGASQRTLERATQKWRQWLALQQSVAAEKPTRDAVIAAGKRANLELAPLLLVREEKPTLSAAATKASDALVHAKGAEKLSLLARLREAKESDSAEALAATIPKLSGDSQQQAREALTECLRRLPPATLRDKLQEDNPEVRSAAALACGRQIAKEHIGDLLQLLEDPEMAVIQSARAALTELSGEDFGPTCEAGSRGRADAVAAWRKWWKERQDKAK